MNIKIKLSRSLLWLVLALPQAHAKDGDVWFTPANPSVRPNGTFDLQLRFDSGPTKIAAYTFDVTFDSLRFQVDTNKGTDGITVGANGFGNNIPNSNNPGMLSVTGFSANGIGPGSDLHVLTLHFKSLAVEGSTPIELNILDFSDESGNGIGPAIPVTGRPIPPAVPSVGQVLTVVKSGTGAGTVTSNPVGIDCGLKCEHAYNSGTLVTLIPIAASGSVFNGWTGDCAADGKITMSAAKSCTANFAPAVTLTIIKKGTGNGTITSNPTGVNCGSDCTGDYLQGTLVTLISTPDATSTLVGWTGDCAANGTVTMNSAKVCTATFNSNASPPPGALSIPVLSWFGFIGLSTMLGWIGMSYSEKTRVVK